MLDIVAVDLAFLRAVNPVQADTFGVLVMQDFDGVAIEDGDDWPEKLADVPNTTSSAPPITDAILPVSPAPVAMLIPPDRIFASPPKITPKMVCEVVRVV